MVLNIEFSIFFCRTYSTLSHFPEVSCLEERVSLGTWRAIAIQLGVAVEVVVAAVLRSLQVDFIYFQFPRGHRLDFVVVVVVAATAN